MFISVSVKILLSTPPPPFKLKLNFLIKTPVLQIQINLKPLKLTLNYFWIFSFRFKNFNTKFDHNKSCLLIFLFPPQIIKHHSVILKSIYHWKKIKNLKTETDLSLNSRLWSRRFWVSLYINYLYANFSADLVLLEGHNIIPDLVSREVYIHLNRLYLIINARRHVFVNKKREGF